MAEGNLQPGSRALPSSQTILLKGALVEAANLDFKDIYKWQAGAALELTIDALEMVCFDSLSGHPQILLGEQPIWSDEQFTERHFWGSLTDEDEELGEQEFIGQFMSNEEKYDLLECPESEIDVESGENEYSELYGEVGDSQSFIDYAWNRYFTDFAGADSETLIIIKDCLKEWKYPYFPISRTLQLEGVNRTLLKWFEDLQLDFGARIVDGQKYNYNTVIPDIIFNVNKGNKLTYEINMEFFDQLLIPDNVIGNISFIPKKAGVPVAMLKSILMKRAAFLGLLAEYLIETQSEFITAKSLPEGIRKIKSIQQDGFLEYLKSLGVKEAEDTIVVTPDGKRKTIKQKDLVSRIFKNKQIKLPFSNTVLRARICLDRPAKNLGRINSAQEVLEKAFDILMLQHPGKILTSSAQAEIIQGVMGAPYSSDQVSRTLWKHLRKKYDEADWPKLRIIGEGRNKLNLPDSDKLDSLSMKELIEKVKVEMGLY